MLLSSTKYFIEGHLLSVTGLKFLGDKDIKKTNVTP